MLFLPNTTANLLMEHEESALSKTVVDRVLNKYKNNNYTKHDNL